MAQAVTLDANPLLEINNLKTYFFLDSGTVRAVDGVNLQLDDSASMDAIDNIILDVKDLKQYFPIRRGFLQRVVGYVKTVDGVSFFIRENEVLGLVGESGCGKTTTGRAILRLYDPTAGEIWYRRRSGELVEISGISQREMKGG